MELTDKVIIILAIGAGAALLQGCGAYAGNYDKVTQYTAAGIKAEADAINGLIRTAKENRTDDSKYFGHRALEEKETTTRHTKKTFWELLVSQGEK